MTVGEICQKQVHFAEMTESVVAAAKRMRRRHLGALVVVNRARRPIGIVTDRDIVVRAVAADAGVSVRTVEDVMTRPVKQVREDAPVEIAVSQMRTGGFRRLPVVDRQGRLVGIVTLDDVLARVAAAFGEIGTLLGRSAPRMITPRDRKRRHRLGGTGSRASRR